MVYHVVSLGENQQGVLNPLQLPFGKLLIPQVKKEAIVLAIGGASASGKV